MRGKIVPDNRILRSAERQLASRGVRPPSRVVVNCNNGTVTLTGTIQYEHQRHTAVQAVQTVEGVRSVNDQLRVTPPVKRT